MAEIESLFINQATSLLQQSNPNNQDIEFLATELLMNELRKLSNRLNPRSLACLRLYLSEETVWLGKVLKNGRGYDLS